jgi:hypothetical protein
MKRAAMKPKAKRYPMPEGRYDEAMECANYTCQAVAYGLESPDPCDGALIVHHLKMKGMGGSADPTINDLANLAVVCGGVTGRDGHHGEIHDNPGRSYDCGLLIRRS